MQDPNLLESCYGPGGQREYPRNTIEGLTKSVSHCHDVNQKLIRANNEITAENLALRNQVVMAIVTAILSWIPSAAVFVWTITR
jgi:hypothetical protein